jgi:hypothetical protein
LKGAALCIFLRRAVVVMLPNVQNKFLKNPGSLENLAKGDKHSWAKSAMDRWIDTDGIDGSIPMVSIDTIGLILVDVIDQSVTYFFFF